MKAWQKGSPSIASPMYPTSEPTPMRCCLCIGQLKCAGNWSQGMALHDPLATSSLRQFAPSLQTVLCTRNNWGQGMFVVVIYYFILA